MLVRRGGDKRVSVIIPSWNGKELLEICLASLTKQTFKNFEIIVVDNGSTDDSVSFIEKFYPQTKLIKLPTNLGFAAAVNKGIKASFGKYVILLNNDTKADKRCLEYLVKIADKHKDVGMVASKMLQFYQPDLIDSAGDYIDAAGHANNIGRGEKDCALFNKEGYVFLVNGGGSLFKMEVFEKVGLLDEDYFAYFEDVDIGLRAQLQGFKAYYQPKAIIWHIHKATSNRNKALTQYLQFRNMTMTIIKDFPRSLLLTDWNWLKIILVNINTIRHLSGQGFLKEALNAEWYILSHLCIIFKKRKIIQSKLTVLEKYFIENVVPKKITFFRLVNRGI